MISRQPSAVIGHWSWQDVVVLKVDRTSKIEEEKPSYPLYCLQRHSERKIPFNS